DEVLEAVEIAVHPALHKPHLVTDVLDEIARLIVHRKAESAVVVVDLVEFDNAVVLHTGVALPGNDMVPLLPHNGGIPVKYPHANLRDPVEVGVIDLAYFFYAVHEFRERLKLRPLVVGGTHWHINIDMSFDASHDTPPLAANTSIASVPLGLHKSLVN